MSSREHPWTRGLALALVTVLGGTVIAVAQETQEAPLDPETMKAYLIEGFERAKRTDLSFVDAIPDSALRWAPTPDVRDFAEQVAHAAGNGFIGPSVFGEDAPGFFADTAAVMNDAEALAEAVTASYDWVLSSLREMPVASLSDVAPFFGGQTLPKWRILAFALEHAMWTRGQLVPYFRIHGIDPPDVQLF